MTRWPDSLERGLADTGRRAADEVIRDQTVAHFNRSDRPMGATRQQAAIIAQPSWYERPGKISQPTLILHGPIDPLIRPEAGRNIASRTPGAEPDVIGKWDHDMPDRIVPTLLNCSVPFPGRHFPQAAQANIVCLTSGKKPRPASQDIRQDEGETSPGV